MAEQLTHITHNRGADEEEEDHSYSSKCYDSTNNMSHQMGQNTSQQLAINQSVKATSSMLPTVLDNRKHDTTNLSMHILYLCIVILLFEL
jgi:hypothetical protein